MMESVPFDPLDDVSTHSKIFCFTYSTSKHIDDDNDAHEDERSVVYEDGSDEELTFPIAVEMLTEMKFEYEKLQGMYNKLEIRHAKDKEEKSEMKTTVKVLRGELSSMKAIFAYTPQMDKIILEQIDQITRLKHELMLITDENVSLKSTVQKGIKEIGRLQDLVETLDNDTDKLRYDVAHIEEMLVMKDKGRSLLQAEMFVKISEWKKLEDELLVDKALINRMNRPKSGLD